MSNNEQPKPGAFVRLKQCVSDHVGASLQGILGLPSTVSQSFILGPSAQARPLGLVSSQNDTNVPSSEGAPNRETVEDFIEARLDSLRGGLYQEHDLACNLFLSLSKYSPLVLNEGFGWTPTPKGLPPHVDPDLFSWTDAFEDLLAASAQRDLMDLGEAAVRNRTVASVSRIVGGPSWVLGGCYYWRLRERGLWEVYFPMCIPWQGYKSPQTIEEWWVAIDTQLLSPTWA